MPLEEHLSDVYADASTRMSRSKEPEKVYDAYQAYIRQLAQKYPEQMAAIQENNTRVKEALLNRLAFDTPTPLGKMDELIKRKAEQSINVPYGSEDSSTLFGGVMGQTLQSKNWDYGDMVQVAGNPRRMSPDVVMMHEAGHAMYPHRGLSISNEDFMRSLDFLRAYVQDDKEAMQETVNFSGYRPSQLLPLSLDVLGNMYQRLKPALSEEQQEKIDSTLKKLDEDKYGAVGKLLGLESRKHTFSKVDKGVVQMLIDLAPAVDNVMMQDNELVVDFKR